MGGQPTCARVLGGVESGVSHSLSSHRSSVVSPPSPRPPPWLSDYTRGPSATNSTGCNQSRTACKHSKTPLVKLLLTVSAMLMCIKRMEPLRFRALHGKAWHGDVRTHCLLIRSRRLTHSFRVMVALLHLMLSLSSLIPLRTFFPSRVSCPDWALSSFRDRVVVVAPRLSRPASDLPTQA